MSKRIQITREQFVASFIKVDKSPNVLISKLEKPPFCHLASTYVIKPVACDEQPFLIQHKNKQQVIVSQKRTQIRRPKAAEVTNFDSDSDDDFNTVSGKTRGKNTVAAVEPEVNPQFPASDPSKVIVIGNKDKKHEEPVVAAQTEKKAAAVEEVQKPAAAAAPVKAKAKGKSAAQVTAEKAQADKSHADMMKAMFAGGSSAPVQAAPVEPVKAAEPENTKKSNAKNAKKNANEEKKEQAQPKPAAQAKPQSAAPKKAAPAKEEAKKVDQNDFAAAFGAANAANDYAAAFGAANQASQEQARKKGGKKGKK